MLKIKKITQNSVAFPDILRTIASPPKQLFVLGDLSGCLESPRLAIVGSRKVSQYGRQITVRLTEAVTRQNVVSVSGLALGVDSIAHRATLDAGGRTIAVLPCGLDRVYPSSHVSLAKRILTQGGALISEYPENSQPYPVNFVARNRLISGLSDALLVTEAALKSGTLHTANFALEQGKTVMAVPGNITSPLSAGTNNLIKSGALPVTEPEDIFEALGLKSTLVSPDDILGDTREETIILQLIAGGTSDAAELLLLSKLEAALFNQTLTMLEIQGKITPLGAAHWALK